MSYCFNETFRINYSIIFLSPFKLSIRVLELYLPGGMNENRNIIRMKLRFLHKFFFNNTTEQEIIKKLEEIINDENSAVQDKEIARIISKLPLKKVIITAAW